MKSWYVRIAAASADFVKSMAPVESGLRSVLFNLAAARVVGSVETGRLEVDCKRPIPHFSVLSACTVSPRSALPAREPFPSSSAETEQPADIRQTTARYRLRESVILEGQAGSVQALLKGASVR